MLRVVSLSVAHLMSRQCIVNVLIDLIRQRSSILDITDIILTGLWKENYRPVSIISVVFKIFEFCLYDQIYQNIDDTLSSQEIGYRKGYSSQHLLITMFENWKKSLNKGGKCSALFVDLSIAF